MDSLSQVLSPFDDIEVMCPLHNIPSIGLCSEYYCQNATNFFCMKCIKEGNTCISKEKHELITLSELLYRFFILQENKTIDLLEINSMIEMIKGIEPKELALVANQFIDVSNKVVDDLATTLAATINLSVQNIKKDNQLKLDEVRKYNNLSKKDLEEIERLSLVEIPESLTSKSLVTQKDVIDYITNNLTTSTSRNKFIEDFKYLSFTDKTTDTVEKIDNLIYLYQLTDEKNEKAFSDKIDQILQEFEDNFDKSLAEIEKVILPEKEHALIYQNRNAIQKFTTNPATLVFKKDICTSAHKANSIDSVFCAFKSIKGEFLVVWGTQSYNIEFYDLAQDKIIHTIHPAHTNTIFSCRHYFDRKGKRDLIISSSYDRSVKVWSLSNNYEKIVDIPSVHTGYYIYSVTILCDEKEDKNYVITTAPNEHSKIWSFKGEMLRTFGVPTESIYFVDVFYDSKESKYYIINANSYDVKSYVFKTGLLYKSYKGTQQAWHMSAIVVERNKELDLIESDGNGNVRIWDFHTAKLKKAITTKSIINLRGICLWNDDFLFSTGSDYQVKLYNLKEGTYVKGFPGHSSTVCSVKKIVHPTYGECLISHALDGKLKLWAQP